MCVCACTCVRCAYVRLEGIRCLSLSLSLKLEVGGQSSPSDALVPYITGAIGTCMWPCLTVFNVGVGI